MARPSRGFEFLEHTADLAIRAWGPDLPAAFAEAARGLFAYMVDLDAVAPSTARTIEVEGEGAATLLWRFLEEARFVAETEAFVFASFAVAIEPRRLVAVGRGEAYDPERHGHLHEIKAVTLHDIRVDPEGHEVAVVVDI